MFASDQDILFVSSNFELRVKKEVYECWLKHRQMKQKDTEQFGVLIGSRIEGGITILVDRCTTPQKKDISQRTSFLMKDPIHQKTIDKAFIESNAELGYIGTWHTHPQDEPKPSIVDLNDWAQCSLRNSDRQLVFAIVGNTQINIYIQINGNLEVAKRKIDE